MTADLLIRQAIKVLERRGPPQALLNARDTLRFIRMQRKERALTEIAKRLNATKPTFAAGD